MREIRPSGSEGGVALTPPSLPLSPAEGSRKASTMLQSRIATLNRSIQRESVLDCGSPLPLWGVGRRARAAEDCRTPRPCGVPSGSWEAVSETIRALASGITESWSWRYSASSLSHYHVHEPRGLTPIFQPESEPTGKSALPCSAESLRLVLRKPPRSGS